MADKIREAPPGVDPAHWDTLINDGRTDEIKGNCYFCGKEVTGDDWCYGCFHFVCEDCDMNYDCQGKIENHKNMGVGDAAIYKGYTISHPIKEDYVTVIAHDTLKDAKEFIDTLLERDLIDKPKKKRKSHKKV